ncbi:MAG TPA: DUF2341 domain-containing protein [Chitinivibrionales bacterium]|nr:DUF2341 domain-containing protein [Chitinivibrionales bacterium]
MERKSKKVFHLLFGAAGLVLAALCACTPMLAGGGSDTEVSGRIVTADGKGNPGTQVSFIPQTYNPAFDSGLAIHITDANGNYRFENISAGEYNLFAVNNAQGARLLRTNIKVATEPVVVPPDSLRKTATVVLPLPDSIIALSGYAYVQGTPICRQVYAGTDAVVFDSVPQCTLSSVQFMTNSTGSVSLLYANVGVDSPGTMVVSPYDSWPHSAKITINTSAASGAAITGALGHFPLLVRLDASNFNFSQTLPGGADIRFTKANGRPLAFETARWDASLSQAVVWVSVDTIYGNSASQYVRMFWGNTAALSASNPNAVFDTAYGFAAVWHLEEEKSGVGTPGLYKDATPAGADGDDWISSTDQSGVVGCGHSFAGSDKISTNSGVTEMAAGSVTIAAWVNLAAAGGVVCGKGKENMVQNGGEKQLYFSDGTPNGASGLRPSFSGKGNGYAFADRDLPLDNRWHYLVFRWNWESGTSGTAAFFLDSSETGITSTYTAAARDNAGDAVSIGYNGIQYLNGFLDEMHISKTARSSDWILFSYENQKPGQKTVGITIEK